jgi:NAD(P)-dependent dehydrogenase (short-subunit alcohol dehydrogenase family)
MGSLDGKIALITGAARGIGAATAQAMVEAGAQVVIADLRGEMAHQTAQRLGDAVSAVQYDAADPASIENIVDVTLERHGRIDVLHNNAAITDQAWKNDTTVVDTELDFWDLTMTVNLRGTFYTTKCVLPHMLEAGGGAIVNTSSIAALTGAGSLVAYGTSKAGIVALTKYVAVQYGRRGIRTNAIAPGATMTENVLQNVPGAEEMVLQTLPFTRAGQPRDLAAAVVFLASDAAAFVNGQLIVVDGGATAGVADAWDGESEREPVGTGAGEAQ